jgi:hypothetical protein
MQSSQPPPLKRFKYLAQQLPVATTSTSVSPANTAVEELSDYISNLPCDIYDGIQWWLQRDGPKKQLPFWAVDILSAPSSEAFVERFFSACGDFTTGKRNRTLESLERKVFIKLNKTFTPNWKLFIIVVKWTIKDADDDDVDVCICMHIIEISSDLFLLLYSFSCFCHFYLSIDMLEAKTND